MAEKLFPLDYPPGVSRNGTRYQAQGRWYDAQLIRFFSKTIRPIGGWQNLQRTVPEVLIGSAFFTAADATAFSAYTADTGLGTGTNPDTADPGAYRVISNKMAAPDTVAGGTNYAHFQSDLANNSFRVEADLVVKAENNATAEITFRGNDQLDAEREYLKVVLKRLAVDTAQIYAQRIVGGAAAETYTINASFALTGVTCRLLVTVIGATVTVARQPVGGGTETAMGSCTFTTDYNDASHKRFGLDHSYASGGSGLTSTWDNYRVYSLSSLTDIDLSSSGVVRKLFAWRLDSTPYLAIGSNTKVYTFAQGSLTDRTPGDLVTGNVDSTNASSLYGFGAYGSGNYGGGDETQAELVPAASWQFDSLGNYLLGVLSSDKRLLYWDGAASTLAEVSGAPVNNRGMVVTGEAIVVCLGADGNPRLAKWGDQGTITFPVPAATNTAGEKEVPGEGALVCGVRGKDVTLLFTDVDMFEMQYIGGTLVYAFNLKGQRCGPVSPHVVAMLDNRAIWMSLGNFYDYNGFVQPLQNDVIDAVFKDFNRTQAAKCFAVTRSQYSEITWYYCSSTSDEIDSYVTWNYVENHWTPGKLPRTSGIDKGAFAYPIMARVSDGAIIEHERGTEMDDVDNDVVEAPFLEGGPIEIDEGNLTIDIDAIQPDEATQAGQVTGSTEATLFLSDRPDAAETAFGPYALSAITDVRLNGRIARLRLDEAVRGDWRVGRIKLRGNPGDPR